MIPKEKIEALLAWFEEDFQWQTKKMDEAPDDSCEESFRSGMANCEVTIMEELRKILEDY